MSLPVSLLQLGAAFETDLNIKSEGQCNPRVLEQVGSEAQTCRRVLRGRFHRCICQPINSLRCRGLSSKTATIHSSDLPLRFGRVVRRTGELSRNIAGLLEFIMKTLLSGKLTKLLTPSVIRYGLLLLLTVQVYRPAVLYSSVLNVNNYFDVSPRIRQQFSACERR